MRNYNATCIHIHTILYWKQLMASQKSLEWKWKHQYEWNDTKKVLVFFYIHVHWYTEGPENAVIKFSHSPCNLLAYESDTITMYGIENERMKTKTFNDKLVNKKGGLCMCNWKQCNKKLEMLNRKSCAHSQYCNEKWHRLPISLTSTALEKLLVVLWWAKWNDNIWVNWRTYAVFILHSFVWVYSLNNFHTLYILRFLVVFIFRECQKFYFFTPDYWHTKKQHYDTK